MAGMVTAILVDRPRHRLAMLPAPSFGDDAMENVSAIFLDRPPHRLAMFPAPSFRDDAKVSVILLDRSAVCKQWRS
jgi:hypothetical protein